MSEGCSGAEHRVIRGLLSGFAFGPRDNAPLAADRGTLVMGVRLERIPAYRTMSQSAICATLRQVRLFGLNNVGLGNAIVPASRRRSAKRKRFKRNHPAEGAARYLAK